MKHTALIMPLLAAASAFPAYAQKADEVITVQGQKMPKAEAPRSATCEALARDPIVRAQMEAAGGDPFMGPRMLLPTRPPRDVDLSSPPLSAAGSALPEIPKARLGASSAVAGGQTNAQGNFDETAGQAAAFGTAQEDAPEQYSLNEALAACRGAYVRGGPVSGESGDGRGSAALGRMNNNFARSRAEIAGRDTTLPMAFALFDQRRYDESLQWFRRSFSKLQLTEGGDEAALFIGKLTLSRPGAAPDPVEAVEWFKRAATAPFNPVTDTPVFNPKEPDRNTAMGEAAVILGNLYRTGFGVVAKNPEESRKWYAKALDVGHIPAAKVLGDIYANGVGTVRDPKKAVSYYKKAAKFGLPSAQYALAEMLYLGDDGVPQDVKEALAWYQAAGKSDHPGALYALARAYDLGEGVKADPAMALGLYKSAALHGSAAAKAALGSFFYEGKVLPKDDATARKWFEEAAKGADPEGMFNLAAMMTRGDGGPRNLPQAWVLMKQAAAQGSDLATRALPALERKMTPAEKKLAEAMLAAR
jgi:TPR repeat protein